MFRPEKFYLRVMPDLSTGRGQSLNRGIVGIGGRIAGIQGEYFHTVVMDRTPVAVSGLVLRPVCALREAMGPGVGPW